jgi:hypothetical protein
MIVYKGFYKNYELERCELLGVLRKRRKDLRGMTQFESGVRWTRSTFGGLVKDKEAISAVLNPLKDREG